MDNLMISTMPIKPYEEVNIGLMIGPTLSDIVGSILNCKKVLSFNLLHSFDNKKNYLSNYINIIKSFGIEYNQIIKDVDWTEQYLYKIEELYKKGVILINEGNILRCDCGRVEMSKDSLKNHQDGNLYYWAHDKVICKLCGKECKSYSQKNLYLEVRQEYCKDISIIPLFSKYEVQDLTKKFLNISILSL